MPDLELRCRIHGAMAAYPMATRFAVIEHITESETVWDCPAFDGKEEDREAVERLLPQAGWDEWVDNGLFEAAPENTPMLVLRRKEGQWAEIMHLPSGDTMKVKVTNVRVNDGPRVDLVFECEPNLFHVERPERVSEYDLGDGMVSSHGFTYCPQCRRFEGTGHTDDCPTKTP